jgi:cytochrome c oxidase subunit II
VSTGYSTLVKPQGIWWKALGRDERLWVSLAVIWGLAMFVMIGFVWPLIGTRQNEIQGYRIEPAEFHARVEAFTATHKVSEIGGIPVVAPPPGDIYLEASAFAWRPILQLKRGETYRLLLSSRDLQHGFSLLMQPRSLNYQVLPGFVLSVFLTPEKAGEYPLACNEYCGLGHHLMLGRIIVTD